MFYISFIFIQFLFFLLFYRIQSTILGQRKPQANKRKKKKRTTERRYSEGEASDYEPKSSEDQEKQDSQQNKKSMESEKPKAVQHDSGVDLTDDSSVPATKHTASTNSKKGKRAPKASIGDNDCINIEFKSDMIFDIEM